MQQNIEIWNLLHDGLISVLFDENKTTLSIFVYTPYLRRKMKPAGICFVLKSYGVKGCTFTDFDGKEEFSSETFDLSGSEILSAESDSMPITLHTTLGNLILDDERIEYFLDSGSEIDYQTIS